MTVTDLQTRERVLFEQEEECKVSQVFSFLLHSSPEFLRSSWLILLTMQVFVCGVRCTYGRAFTFLLFSAACRR